MPTNRYNVAECAAFRRTREAWGGFSNMASGYPLVVNGVHIRTSEAIYQALKFPDTPQAQRAIIAESNPMTAKKVSRSYDHLCRPDWHQAKVKIKVMNWCLEVKLAQNFDAMKALFDASHGLHIVENSSHDAYWGAKPQGNALVGQNVLGRLLMRLRQRLNDADDLDQLRVVQPLDIPDFTLYGQPIAAIDARPHIPQYSQPLLTTTAVR